MGGINPKGSYRVLWATAAASLCKPERRAKLMRRSWQLAQSVTGAAETAAHSKRARRKTVFMVRNAWNSMLRVRDLRAECPALRFKAFAWSRYCAAFHSGIL